MKQAIDRDELKALDLDNSDIRDVLQAIEDQEDDFEAGGYRFISSEVIDQTLADELGSDSYVLGCFSSGAIADATGWPVVLIEAAQKGEQYEAIGDGMSREHVEALAEILRRHDGYGHHFNRYDGGEEEITLAGTLFHVFRID